MPAERDATPFRPARSFVHVRQSASSLVAVLAIGGVVLWLGSKSAPIPSTWRRDGQVIPIWRIVSMGPGIIPALSLHTSLWRLEEVSTRVHRSFERRYLVVMIVACFGLFGGMVSIVLEWKLVLVVLRSLVAWLGLGLLSGRLFGWRLSWVVPIVALFGLISGGGGGGGRYAWWEFSAQPYDHLPSLALGAALLGLGILAFAATPWRLAPLRRTGLRRRGSNRSSGRGAHRE